LAVITEAIDAVAGAGLETDLWPEPVNGAALLNELRETFRRHVVLPPHASETLALLRPIAASSPASSPALRITATASAYRPSVAKFISTKASKEIHW